MPLLHTLELGLDVPEFLRTLTAAFGERGFEESGDVFFHAEPGRSWRIELQPLPSRRLGALQLSRHLVRWTFTGYSEGEAQDLLDRFDRRALRGGG